MTNRIRAVEFHDRRLNAAEAEIHVRVIPERPAPSSEIRGRLTGPVCAYASTMEVAYPMRPLGNSDAAGLTGLVVIPEPSRWDPTSPFLYHATVELWENGTLSDQVQIRRGLRTLGRSSREFLLNGREWKLRGVPFREQADLAQMRRAGINTLLVPLLPEAIDILDLADRLGHFVIGTMSGSGQTLGALKALSDHPCCFGFLYTQEALQVGIPSASTIGVLFGASVSAVPDRLPEAIHYVVCEASDAPDLARLGVPIVAKAKIPWSEAVAESSAHPAAAGWIFEA